MKKKEKKPAFDLLDEKRSALDFILFYYYNIYLAVFFRFVKVFVVSCYCFCLTSLSSVSDWVHVYTCTLVTSIEPYTYSVSRSTINKSIPDMKVVISLLK